MNVPNEFNCSREGDGEGDGKCLMEAYVRRMTLGFPMQGFLGCFEARIQAAAAQKELEVNPGGECPATDKVDPDNSIYVVHGG
jgi:hypothetical protein